MAQWLNDDPDYQDAADLTIEFSYFTPDRGGVEAQYSPDGSRLSVPIYFPWSWPNIIKARRLFLGYSKLRIEGTKKWISRQMPMWFPGDLNLEGDPWLYAKSISKVTGIGPRGKDANDLPAYDWCEMWLSFSSVTFQQMEDEAFELKDLLGPLSDKPDESTLLRNVTITWRSFERILTLPRGIMKWCQESGDPFPFADTAKRMAILEGVGRNEGGVELLITWHEVPAMALPRKAILNCLSCANNAEFAGFPAESLLCMPPELKLYTNALGSRVYDVGYRFRWYAKKQFLTAEGEYVGHNHYLRYIESATPVYDYRRLTVTGEPGAKGPVRLTDFRTLFRPDQG